MQDYYCFPRALYILKTYVPIFNESLIVQFIVFLIHQKIDIGLVEVIK